MSLTKKGLLALDNHTSFHKKMMNLITKDLSSNEIENFTGIFEKLQKNLSETLIHSQPQKISDFPENIEIKITGILGSRGLRDFFYNENIKVGTVIKILKKNNEGILLLNGEKEIELDKRDVYNLLGIQNF